MGGLRLSDLGGPLGIVRADDQLLAELALHVYHDPPAAMVHRSRADDSVVKVVGRILRADLVVVDDIGLLPVSIEAAEGLYRLVDAAYERRSVAISSNLHPAGFDELMPKTLATANVDRLLHHAHLCVTSGESVSWLRPPRAPGSRPWCRRNLPSARDGGGRERSTPSPGRRHERPGRTEWRSQLLGV